MGAARIAMLLLGLIILVLAMPPFFNFPRLGFWLVLSAAIYFFLLYLIPRLWLFVLPLVTVGLDITSWTGRFAYNELDLVFLVTLASGLVFGRYRFKVFSPSPAVITLLIYLVVIALGYAGWIFFVLPPSAAHDNTNVYQRVCLQGLERAGVGSLPGPHVGLPAGKG
jgi:hypothetical protein